MSRSLVARLVDDGAGALRLGEARYLLIRPETLAGLQRAVERVAGPRAAADCLLDGGRGGGLPVRAGQIGSASWRVRA